jgi:hypothetical protein
MSQLAMTATIHSEAADTIAQRHRLHAKVRVASAELGGAEGIDNEHMRQETETSQLRAVLGRYNVDGASFAQADELYRASSPWMPNVEAAITYGRRRPAQGHREPIGPKMRNSPVAQCNATERHS